MNTVAGPAIARPMTVAYVNCITATIFGRMVYLTADEKSLANQQAGRSGELQVQPAASKRRGRRQNSAVRAAGDGARAGVAGSRSTYRGSPAGDATMQARGD
jgi:hypothetical protein